MFDNVAYLCSTTYSTDEDGNEVPGLEKRMVFCEIRSIGMREHYEAAMADIRPELTIVLADYLEYQKEPLVLYDGTLYAVERTYRNGDRIEITLKRRAGDSE